MTRITGILIAAMLAAGILAILYVIAPILIPFFAVVLGVGLLAWCSIRFARLIERRWPAEPD